MKSPNRTEALMFSHASHADCATVPAIADRGNHILITHMITMIIVMLDPLTYRETLLSISWCRASGSAVRMCWTTADMEWKMP